MQSSEMCVESVRKLSITHLQRLFAARYGGTNLIALSARRPRTSRRGQPPKFFRFSDDWTLGGPIKRPV